MLLVLLFLYIKPCIHMNWTLESPRSSSPNDDVCAREDHASERERFSSVCCCYSYSFHFISLRICVISHLVFELDCAPVVVLSCAVCTFIPIRRCSQLSLFRTLRFFLLHSFERLNVYMVPRNSLFNSNVVFSLLCTTPKRVRKSNTCKQILCIVSVVLCSAQPDYKPCVYTQFHENGFVYGQIAFLFRCLSFSVTLCDCRVALCLFQLILHIM